MITSTTSHFSYFHKDKVYFNAMLINIAFITVYNTRSSSSVVKYQVGTGILKVVL